MFTKILVIVLLTVITTSRCAYFFDNAHSSNELSSTSQHNRQIRNHGYSGQTEQNQYYQQSSEESNSQVGVGGSYSPYGSSKKQHGKYMLKYNQNQQQGSAEQYQQDSHSLAGYNRQKKSQYQPNSQYYASHNQGYGGSSEEQSQGGYYNNQQPYGVSYQGQESMSYQQKQNHQNPYSQGQYRSPFSASQSSMSSNYPYDAERGYGHYNQGQNQQAGASEAAYADQQNQRQKHSYTQNHYHAQGMKQSSYNSNDSVEAKQAKKKMVQHYSSELGGRDVANQGGNRVDSNSSEESNENVSSQINAITSK